MMMRTLVACVAALVVSSSACGSTAPDEHGAGGATTEVNAGAPPPETYEPAAPPVDRVQVPDTTGPPSEAAAPKLLIPGRTYSLDIGTHCGVAVLSRDVHGHSWRTDEAEASTGWTPPEWVHPTHLELLTVLVVLSADESRLTATYNGRSVVYRKVTAADPVFSCA